MNNLPVLKFGNIKRNHSNFVHCYNCKRVMEGIPFECITKHDFVTTWKRERDALIDKEVILNGNKLVGKVKLLEIMHYYPCGLPTHVVGYYINDNTVAYYTYCELTKKLFEAACR